MALLLDVIKSLRPRQWVKNLTLFAALIFSGNLFKTGLFIETTLGVLIFSLLASSVYIINDIVDAPSDRLHPFKKERPIAAGRIPVSLAITLSILGVFFSILLGWRLSNYFGLMLLAYFALQITYTFFLKHIIIFDVIVIATGFMARVYAGAILINAHLSIWFLLGIISAALFLAVGKRRAEINILEANVAAKHRATLSQYTPELLDTYLAMTATAAFLSWALFTFFEPQGTSFELALVLAKLPLTLSGTSKWLMATIPVVIYGIMRYLFIIYQGSRAEAPERVLLTDTPLLTTVGLWGLMVITILYGISP
ncbi:MAG: UbiA prenyltransferase [Microgenomates group bacterium GW2011_GWA1_Microgenomates_45_10]|nr:MAG: UbiA prenyltransferase [Microgenomates group bacterium GW2011_GWB1_44_8]KKT87245.1 MAG: UbiA prenyltransferase [Microgenomates group bacterium GW2011_GWA1_Microgenomates_45_10]